MRQEAFERMRNEWQADLPAILDGLDKRPYPQGWALPPEWDAGEDVEPFIDDGPLARTMQEVLRVCCYYTGLSEAEMRGPKRFRRMSWRRFMMIHLMQRLNPHRTIAEIAHFLERDHTSCLHALKQWPMVLGYDEGIAAEYGEICKHFGIKP